MLVYVVLGGVEVLQWTRVVDLHLVGVDHDGLHVTVLAEQPATFSIK